MQSLPQLNSRELNNEFSFWKADKVHLDGASFKNGCQQAFSAITRRFCEGSGSMTIQVCSRHSFQKTLAKPLCYFSNDVKFAECN